MTTQTTDKKKVGRPAGAAKPAPTPPAALIPKLADQKQRVIDDLATILTTSSAVGLDITLEIGFRATREIVDDYHRERLAFDAQFRARTIAKLAASGLDVSGLPVPETTREPAPPHAVTSTAATGA